MRHGAGGRVGETARLAPWRDQDAVVLEGDSARSGTPAEETATGGRGWACRTPGPCHPSAEAAISDVFGKKTRKTPRDVIERCRRRLEAYDRAARERKKR